MRKCIKSTPLLLIVLIIFASLFLSFPTFAADLESSHITETALLGNLKDDGSTCGVFTILNLVVDILSTGVGILGAIGITVVGIKYLTAGGNEEQTRKAKHRMLQIVIGLATYALIYAGLQFLIPGGKLDFTQRCEIVSNEDLAKIKAEEAAKKAAAAAEQKSSGGTSESGSDSSTDDSGKNTACLKNALESIRDQICGLKSGSERIAKTAELLAFSSKKASKHSYSNSFKPNKWSDLKKPSPTNTFNKPTIEPPKATSKRLANTLCRLEPVRHATDLWAQ